MVHFFKNLFIYSVFCFWFAGLSATFYGKIDEWYDRNQNVFCFYDYHKECTDFQAGINQQKEFVDFAKKYQALAIIEDTSEDPSIKDHDSDLPIYCADSPLLHLHKKLLDEKIPYINVEFRFYLGYYKNFLSLIEKHPTVFNKESMATQEVLTEIRGQLIEEFKAALKQHEDTMKNIAQASLTYFYEHCLEEITQAIHKNIGRVTTSNIRFPKDEKKAAAFYETIFNCESLLIDNRILHAIYKNRDKKVIFICAGGKHIEFVSFLLEHLGFTKFPSLLPEKELFIEDEKVKAESAVNIKEFFEISHASYKRFFKQAWDSFF